MNLLNHDVSTGMNSIENPFFNVTDSIYEQFGARIKDFNSPKCINKLCGFPQRKSNFLSTQWYGFMRESEKDSLIIGRLYWVPQAKPKK